MPTTTLPGSSSVDTQCRLHTYCNASCSQSRLLLMYELHILSGIISITCQHFESISKRGGGWRRVRWKNFCEGGTKRSTFFFLSGTLIWKYVPLMIYLFFFIVLTYFYDLFLMFSLYLFLFLCVPVSLFLLLSLN